MKKDFICIVCPRGCHIHVDDNLKITGNKCKRGIDYVKTELKEPKRILTTTVRTIFPETPRISVKTDAPIPKAKIYQVMDTLNSITVEKEMKIGEILVKNILNTQSNIILTKPLINKKEKI